MAEGVDFVKKKPKHYEQTNGQGRSRRRMCKKLDPRESLFLTHKFPGLDFREMGVWVGYWGLFNH